MMINYVIGLISLYCILESVAAAGKMDGGDRACRFVYFLFCGVAGVHSLILAFEKLGTWWDLIMITTIALGILPRMVYRIFGNQRIA